MKRCPECRRDYHDDSLRYCLDDGTALVDGPATPFLPDEGSPNAGDDSATALLHSSIVPNGSDGIEPATSIRVTATGATSRDSLLIIEFENTTGEDILNHTLKTALGFSLAQSPYLDIVSDTKVSQALRLMKRQPNERVTRELAEELCLRLNLKAYLAGSISNLGAMYLLTLEAVNAGTGESLGREFEQANSKEEILGALGRAASGIRKRLGESLNSIQKYGVPLDATTSSFEAWKFYRLGIEQANSGRQLEAIPFYQKSLEFDPGFATAYAALAVIYCNTKQWKLAAEMATKAFELRDSVGEAEKLRISFFYYKDTMGEIDKAITTLELWRKTYTLTAAPLVNLADCYIQLGQFDKAASICRDGIDSTTFSTSALYANLADSLLPLGRYEEVKETCNEAFVRNFDASYFHAPLFLVGFIEGDAAAMAENLEWFSGRRDEYLALDLQTGVAAFRGRWREAQDFSRKAINLATRSNAKEVGARFFADQALRVAFWSSGSGLPGGDEGQLKTVLKTQVNKALNLGQGKDVVTYAALALAVSGQAAESISLVEKLNAERPKDTLLNELWFPMIRAATLLQQRKSEAAIEQLLTTERYEKAAQFYPQYLRGLAYLQLQKKELAVTEFDKILNNRGNSPLSSIYPLAQLGKARILKDKAEYEKFLELWKDADADMPALVAAKAELDALP
jgi:tetratricopeptide (TPR) repeat protein